MSRARRPNIDTVPLSGSPWGPPENTACTFFQTYVRVIPDDEVIQHFDAQQAARLHEPVGQGDVLRARLRIAAGMVVHQHDGRGAAPNRVS